MSDTARMGACEECGSSDGNATYSDGHTFCYVCKVYKKGNNMQNISKTKLYYSNFAHIYLV